MSNSIKIFRFTNLRLLAEPFHPATQIFVQSREVTHTHKLICSNSKLSVLSSVNFGERGFLPFSVCPSPFLCLIDIFLSENKKGEFLLRMLLIWRVGIELHDFCTCSIRNGTSARVRIPINPGAAHRFETLYETIVIGRTTLNDCPDTWSRSSWGWPRSRGDGEVWRLYALAMWINPLKTIYQIYKYFSNLKMDAIVRDK